MQEGRTEKGGIYPKCLRRDNSSRIAQDRSETKNLPYSTPLTFIGPTPFQALRTTIY